MDELGEVGYFLLNIVMLVILTAWLWGIQALMIFGIIMAPVGLITLVALFFEAATGHSPLQFLRNKLSACL